MFVIFDFDGTLCKIDHRLHCITGPKKDWDRFYSLCVGDVPNWPINNTLKAMLADPYTRRIEIWSGRSIRVIEESRDWLNRHGIPPEILTRMRPDGDNTPDDVLKETWLADEYPHEPDLVFDDRQRVVDMWRANGIVCAQVDAWKEKK